MRWVSKPREFESRRLLNCCPYSYSDMVNYMKRETQRKGDLAKAKSIATFTAMGYDVAVLITESAAYDIIVDTPEGLQRVQVKYTSTDGVDLRKIHSNSTGYVVKLQGGNDYDLLYVFHPVLGEFLYRKCLEGRQNVKLSQMEKISTDRY